MLGVDTFESSSTSFPALLEIFEPKLIFLSFRTLNRTTDFLEINLNLTEKDVMVDFYLESDSLIRIVPWTVPYKDDPQMSRSKGRLRKFSFHRQIQGPRDTDICI